MLRTHWEKGTPNTVFRAFPMSGSLSEWLTKAIAFVEAGPPSAGKFAAQLDDNETYALFIGPNQPTHFGLAIKLIEFPQKITVTIG